MRRDKRGLFDILPKFLPHINPNFPYLFEILNGLLDIVSLIECFKILDIESYVSYSIKNFKNQPTKKFKKNEKNTKKNVMKRRRVKNGSKIRSFDAP